MINDWNTTIRHITTAKYRLHLNSRRRLFRCKGLAASSNSFGTSIPAIFTARYSATFSNSFCTRSASLLMIDGPKSNSSPAARNSSGSGLLPPRDSALV